MVVVYWVFSAASSMVLIMALLAICFPGPVLVSHTHPHSGDPCLEVSASTMGGGRYTTEGVHRTLKDIAVLYRFGLPRGCAQNPGKAAMRPIPFLAW